MSVGTADLAEAQGRTDCRSPLPASLGVAFVRSSPYLDLAPGVVEPPAQGSLMVKGGALFAGRAELPVRGPLRLRLEGATARWSVQQTTYGPDGAMPIADTSLGDMSAHHLVGLVGLQMGRAPVCAHVSAGGGFYALDFQGASARRPGAALAAGIDFPTGQHGAILVDAVLHLIATRGNHPIASSTVPALNVLLGWAYRF